MFSSATPLAFSSSRNGRVPPPKNYVMQVPKGFSVQVLGASSSSNHPRTSSKFDTVYKPSPLGESRQNQTWPSAPHRSETAPRTHLTPRDAANHYSSRTYEPSPNRSVPAPSYSIYQRNSGGNFVYEASLASKSDIFTETDDAEDAVSEATFSEAAFSSVSTDTTSTLPPRQPFPIQIPALAQAQASVRNVFPSRSEPFSGGNVPPNRDSSSSSNSAQSSTERTAERGRSSPPLKSSRPSGAEPNISVSRPSGSEWQDPTKRRPEYRGNRSYSSQDDYDEDAEHDTRKADSYSTSSSRNYSDRRDDSRTSSSGPPRSVARSQSTSASPPKSYPSRRHADERDDSRGTQRSSTDDTKDYFSVPPRKEIVRSAYGGVDVRRSPDAKYVSLDGTSRQSASYSSERDECRPTRNSSDERRGYQSEPSYNHRSSPSYADPRLEDRDVSFSEQSRTDRDESYMRPSRLRRDSESRRESPPQRVYADDGLSYDPSTRRLSIVSDDLSLAERGDPPSNVTQGSFSDSPPSRYAKEDHLSDQKITYDAYDPPFQLKHPTTSRDTYNPPLGPVDDRQLSPPAPARRSSQETTRGSLSRTTPHTSNTSHRDHYDSRDTRLDSSGVPLTDSPPRGRARTQSVSNVEARPPPTRRSSDETRDYATQLRRSPDNTKEVPRTGGDPRAPVRRYSDERRDRVSPPLRDDGNDSDGRREWDGFTGQLRGEEKNSKRRSSEDELAEYELSTGNDRHYRSTQPYAPTRRDSNQDRHPERASSSSPPHLVERENFRPGHSQRRSSDNDQVVEIVAPPQGNTAAAEVKFVATARNVRWNDNLVLASPVLPSQRRKGWYNRRGDQLWTNDGAFKPPSPGMEYPIDLDLYPDFGEGWMNEEGTRIDMQHHHVPKVPLRSALKRPRIGSQDQIFTMTEDDSFLPIPI